MRSFRQFWQRHLLISNWHWNLQGCIGYISILFAVRLHCIIILIMLLEQELVRVLYHIQCVHRILIWWTLQVLIQIWKNRISIYYFLLDRILELLDIVLCSSNLFQSGALLLNHLIHLRSSHGGLLLDLGFLCFRHVILVVLRNKVNTSTSWLEVGDWSPAHLLLEVLRPVQKLLLCLLPIHLVLVLCRLG